MPRSRTQKQVAKRIDLSYFKHASPMRRVRRVLTVLCVLAAIGWVAGSAVRVRGGKVVLVDTIHNPGHVASPHARFENDCRVCHGGQAGSGFRLKVTDDACLKCHDAAMHDENQKLATDISSVARRRFALAISDPHHPGGARSAGCVNCHTEHRGEVQLLGLDDQNCVFCHRNVTPATASGHASVQNVVTRFVPGEHPTFGRSLVAADGKWFDPTRIKFNHKFHFDGVPALQNAAQTCVLCHSTQPQQPSQTEGMPPFAAKKSQPAIRSGGEGYMRPVSYEENCSGCHAIEIAGVAVSHVELSLVRSQLADLAGLYRVKLAAMSPEDRAKQLTESAPAASSGRGRRGAAPAATKTITEDEWIKKQLDKAKSEAGDWLDQPAAQKVPQIAALKELNQADSLAPDQSILEAYIVYGTSNACAKCHDINAGTTPALLAKSIASVSADAATQPATQPMVSPTMLLATEPTGIPDAPRHWFANAHFDHRPHRDMSCVDCHGNALLSGADKIDAWTPAKLTGTRDILSPDIDHFAVKGKNCVDCHKPGGPAAGAVTGSCVSCHVFHDRSKERAPEISLAPPN